VTDLEIDAVVSALRSGWVAPLGPEVDAFEKEAASFGGADHAVALSSGTAALHLGLLALGVGPGDEVVVPTMTFGATAFAVTYVGAAPVFLDIEAESWNLDPQVLEAFLSRRASLGQVPAAIIPVDVFGRSCDYERIMPIADRYEVPVLADAAEALGATNGARPCGSFGRASVISFNGNKIMTTSGGGMLLTDDAAMAAKVRFWATQSRESTPWYEHEEIGYNYRMSNILAALGRAQLARLPQMIERRRQVRDRYSVLLADVAGVSVLGDPPWGRSNAWLTTVRFDPALHPDAPTRIRELLEATNIEARPVWKPMHQQPVFARSQSYLTGMADAVFAEGLCLPSGVAMTDQDVDHVAGLVLREVST
jgi:dTDP-4-amino-4,6-dideoxygalactose transaminase